MTNPSTPMPIPLDEVVITFARSAGPGGQNVNKVNTKAVLRWRVRESEGLPEDVRRRFCTAYASRITREGELVIQSQRHRTAGRNASDCLEKLRAMLIAVARPPKSRKPTRPTRGSVGRRLDAKRRRSQRKSGRRNPAEE
jgi:ribosome-associated protein